MSVLSCFKERPEYKWANRNDFNLSFFLKANDSNGTPLNS